MLIKIRFDHTAAGLAQSVERLIAERKVAGSIPGVGPILRVLRNDLGNEGTPFALQAARPSRGSDDHLRWRSRFCFCFFFFLHLLVFNYSSKRHNKLNSRKVIAIACQQALRDALAAGRENEGDLATTSLEFEFHLQSLWLPVD